MDLGLCKAPLGRNVVLKRCFYLGRIEDNDCEVRWTGGASNPSKPAGRNSSQMFHTGEL